MGHPVVKSIDFIFAGYGPYSVALCSLVFWPFLLLLSFCLADYLSVLFWQAALVAVWLCFVVVSRCSWEPCVATVLPIIIKLL